MPANLLDLRREGGGGGVDGWMASPWEEMSRMGAMLGEQLGVRDRTRRGCNVLYQFLAASDV